MKRLFPAPWLSLALWLLWLVLNLSVSPGHLLLGAVLGFIAPLMMAPLRPLPIRIRRPWVILRLFLLVGRDVILSNLAVAWGVLNAGRRAPRSAFVKVPLDLRDANGLAALSMICTVIPGTVWSELALDRSILLLHVFDLGEQAPFIQHFKDTYERPLMEIFE
ncbi:Na+/H+ antiporter subunit E [Pseudomonas vanderleydeniana]|uniref:Na+/H+ antiporter subunit E n=1 Tax=Pseudomonas vanderleydeniana TaxID=2745495 RepID=A0A9E6TTW3_9PSED|nr:Na+/H+ antiporter subunit E [Pseudomonas vanderleydeniana]QXI31108.1 Na+/H+ antiporter subunit E [Pseudomonas vanderleydeniana]